MNWQEKVKNLEKQIKGYQHAIGHDRESLSQTIMDTVRVWYLINQDVSYVSDKSILVKLSDDRSFWLPKRFVEVYEHYWKVVIPIDGFVAKDLQGKTIHFLPLWRRFGNPERATSEAMQSLIVDRHVPPHLTPLKGVKADDRLKR